MARTKPTAQEISATAKDKLKEGRELVEHQVGGPARLQIILVLAAILGLDSADKAAISAVADGLERAFGLTNTDIGILVSATSFVGAIITLPMGLLVDRLRRQYLLMVAIALWSIAILLSGTALSFSYLLFASASLGAATAVTMPAVASLTGDYFPARERAHIYGFILAGELVGTGAGFVLSGLASSWFGWRWGFFVLSLPSAALVWVIWRYLPEPARGGQSHLLPGQEHVRSVEEAEAEETGTGQAGPEPPQTAVREQAQEIVRRAQVQPREELILREDPTDRSLWWAIGYISRIPTFVLLVIASSIGYFFFAGVRAFVMIYLTQHYQISRNSVSGLLVVVGIGALAGVLAGGRISEWLFRREWLSARVVVPAGALFIAVLFFAPAIWTTNIGIGLGFYTLGAAALAAANPPLDAARLDIFHSRLWGRSESLRSTIRMVMEGSAPALFGFISESAFGGGERGLMWTFLVMLIPLFGACSVAFVARHTYPRDVATAGASADAIKGV